MVQWNKEALRHQIPSQLLVLYEHQISVLKMGMYISLGVLFVGWWLPS